MPAVDSDIEKTRSFHDQDTVSCMSPCMCAWIAGGCLEVRDITPLLQPLWSS